jgi:hypothetical protein
MDAALQPSGLSCSATTFPACGGMSFFESASRFHTRALWSADAVAANLQGEGHASERCPVKGKIHNQLLVRHFRLLIFLLSIHWNFTIVWFPEIFII